MEYQRNLPDARMFNTHRAMDSELVQTRADLLHNRQVLRTQLVVRNGFSRLLLDHEQAGSNPSRPDRDIASGWPTIQQEALAGLNNGSGH
jgi:hypothetical protein